jgi:hypothetical protein
MNFGQTRTRTRTSEADSIAMNASDAELPGLCRQGNRLACQLAQIPQPTEQDLQDMARRRDTQASADREALAKRLENVGQHAVAQAVRQKEDVVYAGGIALRTWHLVAIGFVAVSLVGGLIVYNLG